MIEVKGDFWEYVYQHQPDAIVCTTNKVVKKDGRLVMGAGIAKDFRDKVPNLDLIWGKRLEKNPTQNLMITRWEWSNYLQWDRDPWLVAFPTKYDWKHDSDIHLILDCARTLATVTEVLDWKSVVMTRVGCGNGNLLWADVKPLINKYLDKRFVVVSNE